MIGTDEEMNRTDSRREPYRLSVHVQSTEGPTVAFGLPRPQKTHPWQRAAGSPVG